MFETAFDIYYNEGGSNEMISPSIIVNIKFQNLSLLTMQAKVGVKIRKPRPLFFSSFLFIYLFIYFVLPRQNWIYWV